MPSRPRRIPLAARLATAMALLTGCSAVGGIGGDTADTELSVMANTTDKTSMQAVVEAFHRAHPGIRVTVRYADTNTLQKELPRRLRTGDAPDVFTVWPGNGNPASVVALEREDFPRTYSGLLELCDTARRHGKVLFALGNATPWVTQLVDYALVATTVYADDPDFDAQMEYGRRTFARSGWRQAMAKYLEMREHGCFSSDPLHTTYEEAVEQVADGRAVGVVQVAGTLPDLRAAAPGTHFRMTALPATDDPEATRMPGAVSAAYGLDADTPHRRAALAFIDFLGSERGQNLYNKSGATLPALPNDSSSVDPAVAEVARRQKEGTTVPFMDQRWPNSEVQQAHFAQVRALFEGTTDIDRALAAMDSAYR
ncbi:ABC transporter substrate-binding protein [Streptomyces sp. NPDC002784]